MSTTINCPICGAPMVVGWDHNPDGTDAWEGDFADDVIRFRWHREAGCEHAAYAGGVNSEAEVRAFPTRHGAFREVAA